MQTTLNPVYTAPAIGKSTVVVTPWYIYTAVLATVSIVIGGRWDISWHISIGRDGLFSPPHLAIYLGGILAGIGGAYQLFKTTFSGNKTEKEHSVWFWGFRAPLGALFSIWGALAMLTSAPFDDWWHNAYGLDVEILTPPHTVLLLGVIMIQLGSMITLLTFQNQLEDQDQASEVLKQRVRMMFVFTVGMIVTAIGIAIWELTGRRQMHLPSYYLVAGLVFPIFLVSAGRASQMKWPMTWAAIWYFTFAMAINWILPLFPAKPLLGPIYTPVTHFVALKFPFLLMVPAFAMDLMMQRVKANDWIMSLWLGITFFFVFLLTHWLWGEFLMTENARNWVFYQDATAYFSRPNYKFRYNFIPYRGTNFYLDMGRALFFTILMCRIGLWWGNWMKQVKR